MAVSTPALLPSTGKLGARELAEAYLSRFPALKTAAKNLIGLDQTAQLMDQAQKGEPLMRKQVETFIRLVLNSNSGALDEKEAAPLPQAAQQVLLTPNKNPAAPPAP